MQKKPLSAKQVKSLSKLLEEKPRDRALFHAGIDSMLRSSDLRQLRVEDVVDSMGLVREECSITQQKTKRTVTFTLSAPTCEAIQNWVTPALQPTALIWASSKTRPSTLPSTTRCSSPQSNQERRTRWQMH